MIEPLKTEPIVIKLLEKTHQGRVDWERWDNGYRCTLGDEYYFLISKVEDSYLLSMKDRLDNEIFQEIAREEIYYVNPGDQERLEMFRDLFELARRKAVRANEKIAGAYSTLEKI